MFERLTERIPSYQAGAVLRKEKTGDRNVTTREKKGMHPCKNGEKRVYARRNVGKKWGGGLR